MATTLGRLDPLVTWPHEVTWLIKSDISPCLPGLCLPKLTRWIFIVKGHHPFSLLMIWSRNQVITWQIENVISQLPRDLWLWKLARVVGSNGGQLSIKSHNLLITWSYKVTWQMKNVINSLSRDLSLSNVAEGWLMIRSHMSNRKATYSFDHLVTWVHVTNELRYIFTSAMPIATKLNRVMACTRSLHSKSSLVLWSRDHL